MAASAAARVSPTLCRPAVARPTYRVSTDELVDHYAVRYAEHDRIDDALKIMRKTSVETRWLSRRCPS